MKESLQRIYDAVRKIPRGKVATYGQIARVAGLPRRARLVGYALAASSGVKIPWHRVINASGGISARSEPMFERDQRGLLENEGVVFTRGGKVKLSRYQWRA